MLLWNDIGISPEDEIIMWSKLYFYALVLWITSMINPFSTKKNTAVDVAWILSHSSQTSNSWFWKL